MNFLLRQLVRVFFRRVEVVGLPHVPAAGGGIVISWHPNALIDPGLILTHFPRPIVFGARHGLFRWPILGWVMRSVGTVPIHRRVDLAHGQTESDRREANRKSLDALAEAVAKGAFAALFPEGLSHDEPHPVELKTGAARLFYRAQELTPETSPPPVIIPVGLHYDHKRLFGSSVLLEFLAPLVLDSDLATPPAPDAKEELRRGKYRRLTDELQRALHEIVHATESWELHHAMHRARKLIRAERAHRSGATLEAPDIKERVLGFSRLWRGYNARLETHPQETRELLARVRKYDADLRALGVDDHELDASPELVSKGLAAIAVSQAILVYLLLPPILLIGYIANLLPAVLVWGVSKWASKAHKDEASAKLLVGTIAFPVTWLMVAFLMTRGEIHLAALYPSIPSAPWVTGVIAFLLSAAGAVVAFNYQRLARRALRSIRVRLTRSRRSQALRRLRSERAQLYESLMRLAEGLVLPGTVERDGRVVEL